MFDLCNSLCLIFAFGLLRFIELVLLCPVVSVLCKKVCYAEN